MLEYLIDGEFVSYCSLRVRRERGREKESKRESERERERRE